MVDFFLSFLGLFILNPLMSYLNILVCFVVYQCTVVDSTKRAKLDRLFSKNGYMQRRSLGLSKYPAEGWCLVFINSGIVIGYKSTIRREQKGDFSYYDLYIFGYATFKWIQNKLDGNENTIDVDYVSNPTIWRYDVTRAHLKIEHTPHEWQTDLIQKIIETYKKKKCCSVIVNGPPGVGKSEIALLLNKELFKIKDKNCKPVTIIADPTKKGMTMGNLIDYASKETPVILLFNEYDSIVKHAEDNGTEKTKSDGMCIAETRTSLLDTLDRLNTFKHVILITTMNGDPYKDIPSVYIRSGRIDVIYSVVK